MRSLFAEMSSNFSFLSIGSETLLICATGDETASAGPADSRKGKLPKNKQMQGSTSREEKSGSLSTPGKNQRTGGGGGNTLYFKISFYPCDNEAQFSAAINPVFSVTRSFRNHPKGPFTPRTITIKKTIKI